LSIGIDARAVSKWIYANLYHRHLSRENEDIEIK
jgi:hypothetical protein